MIVERIITKKKKSLRSIGEKWGRNSADFFRKSNGITSLCSENNWWSKINDSLCIRRNKDPCKSWRTSRNDNLCFSRRNIFKNTFSKTFLGICSWEGKMKRISKSKKGKIVMDQSYASFESNLKRNLAGKTNGQSRDIPKIRFSKNHHNTHSAHKKQNCWEKIRHHP